MHTLQRANAYHNDERRKAALCNECVSLKILEALADLRRLHPSIALFDSVGPSEQPDMIAIAEKSCETCYRCLGCRKGTAALWL
jgi:hypothetical protein